MRNQVTAVVEAFFKGARERGGPLALVFVGASVLFALAGSEELLVALLTGNPPRSPSGVWAAMAATFLAGVFRQITKEMHRRELWDQTNGFSWGLVAGFVVVAALVLLNQGLPRYYTPFMERDLPKLFFALSAYLVLVWIPASALVRSHRIHDSHQTRAMRRAAGSIPTSPEEFRLEGRAQDGQWVLLKKVPQAQDLSEKLEAFVQDGFRDYDEVRIRRIDAT